MTLSKPIVKFDYGSSVYDALNCSTIALWIGIQIIYHQSICTGIETYLFWEESTPTSDITPPTLVDLLVLPSLLPVWPDSISVGSIPISFSSDVDLWYLSMYTIITIKNISASIAKTMAAIHPGFMPFDWNLTMKVLQVAHAV